MQGLEYGSGEKAEKWKEDAVKPIGKRFMGQKVAGRSGGRIR